MRVRSFLIATYSLLFSVSIDADWSEGNWYWPTKYGREVLKFEPNNHLVFQSFYDMDDKKRFFSLFGTWEYRLNPCESSDIQKADEATTAEGSLVLQINSTQCCLNVALQSNKLLLTKVWVKGAGLAVYGYCSDNVLLPLITTSD